MQSIDELLNERDSEYGGAWLICGQLVRSLDLSAILRTPYTHNWIMIFSKVIRILASPSKLDHWQDIAGYATLVARHISESLPQESRRNET